ncbi:hypothetical protein [Peptostreptococcus faecalis]|uniref:hypothetical protein n=1 Tax=Peptostreptococcus faecalis TaxID=2045015 RepID=UPI000C7E6BB2|nr:hypothetical protein [Peptostreptococcus faecalis]
MKENKNINNENNIESLFDKDFELFIQGEIEAEFTPSEDVKERIKAKVQRNIEMNYEHMSNEGSNEGVSIHNDNIEKNRGEIKMKKKTTKSRFNQMKYKVAASVAAVCIVIGAGVPIATGKDILTVVKEVQAGRLSVEEVKEEVDTSKLQVALPEELKGKVFDKDGNVVEKFSKELEGKIYDSHGKLIRGFGFDDQSDKYVIRTEESYKEMKATFATLEEALKHLKFTPKVLEGFKVDKVELIKGDGEISNEYSTVYLSKGADKIRIEERVASEDNAYSIDGDDVKKVRVNGKEAILIDDKNVEIDNGDTFIGVYAKDSSYRGDKLVKLCETLK